MKRFAMSGLAILLVGVMLAMGCGGGGGGGEEAEPTATPTQVAEQPGELPGSYKFFMEWSDSMGSTGEMQFWVKGEKWRTDWSATQQGTESEFLMVYDGEFAYMYMSAANMVYKYASESAMSNPGAAYAAEFADGYYGEVSDATMLAGFQAGCSGGASIDGQETVAGQSCTKFTCNFEGGGVSHYWIADSGWLVKGEVTASGYTYTMQYSDIELNPSIDDSVFDINSVAPGVPVTDLSGM